MSEPEQQRRIRCRLGMGRLPADQRRKRRAQPPKRLQQAPARPPSADRRQVHRPDPGVTDKKPRRSTAGSPPPAAAFASGCCASARRTTREQPSGSSAASWSGSRCESSRSGPATAPSSGAGLCWHVLGCGIRHACIKPAAPQAQRHPRAVAPHRRRGVLCGLLEGIVIDDTGLFNDKPRQWEDSLRLRPSPRQPRRPDPI